jgi:hypothetical protein
MASNVSIPESALTTAHDASARTAIDYNYADVDLDDLSRPLTGPEIVSSIPPADVRIFPTDSNDN